MSVKFCVHDLSCSVCALSGCCAVAWTRLVMAPISAPFPQVVGLDERTIWIITVAAVVSIVLFFSLLILLWNCGCCRKQRQHQPEEYGGPMPVSKYTAHSSAMQRVSSVDPRYKTMRVKARDESWKGSDRRAPTTKKTLRQGKTITFVLPEEPKAETPNEVSKKKTAQPLPPVDKAPKVDEAKKASVSKGIPLQQMSARTQKKTIESRAQLERDRQWRQLHRGGESKRPHPDQKSDDKEKVAQTLTPKIPVQSPAPPTLPPAATATKAASGPAIPTGYNWQIRARTIVAPPRPSSRHPKVSPRPSISARPRRSHTRDATNTFFMREKQLTDTGTLFVPPSQTVAIGSPSIKSGAGSVGSEKLQSRKGKGRSGESRSHRVDRTATRKGQRRREDSSRSAYIN